MNKLLLKIGGGALIITLIITLSLGISNKSKINTKVKSSSEDKVVYKACKDNTISEGETSTTLEEDENGLIGFDSDIVEKYNITNEIINEDTQIKITVNPFDPDSNKLEELKKAVFTLSKINDKEAPSGKTVSAGNDLIIDLNSISSSYKNNADNDMKLTFVSKNVLVTYNGEDCLAGVSFDVVIEGAFSSPITAATIDNSLRGEEWSRELENEGNEIAEISLEGTQLDCSKPETIKTDFDRSFCSDQSAVSSGQTLENLTVSNNLIDSDGTYRGNNISLTCDYKNISNLGIGAGSSYYTKKSVFTVNKTINKNLNYAYRYRFAPGNYLSDNSKFTCKLNCTEKVSVEYGPPVAVKAGLCFEYQVKATSYVNCTVAELPKKPRTYTKFCSPRPRCVHHKKKGKDVVKDRAGPSEDFDSCIVECDGGKYTNDCSKKCYDEVYVNNSKNMLSYSDRLVAKKLYANDSGGIRAQINEINGITSQYPYTLNNYNEKPGPDVYYGCYYWGDDGKIHWAGDDKLSPSIYYKIEDPHRNYKPYTVVGDGFIRKEYSDGDVCGADCHYSTKTCRQRRSGTIQERLDGNEYLNIGVAKADNTYNDGIYHQAVNECKAKAICSTHTATFSISVGSSTSITGTSDTLTFTDQKVSNGGKSVEQILNDAKYLKKIEGCYQNGNTNNIWYNAVWGFPGACVSQKYGTIDNNGNKNCGDDFKENKYCLPFNLNYVNQKWWRYYYTKLFGSATDANTSLQSKEFKEKFGDSWEVNSLSGFTPSWNIVASARQFGFFRWNIDVSCFYGFDELDPPCTPGDCKKYYIRTVDLKNLFPSREGAVLNDPTNSGSTPPLNWSEYATNTKKDTTKLFDSKPNEYFKWVQKKGYAIYNESNLDYEVTLTPDKIKTIKGLSNGYGVFPGEMRSNRNTSVSNYKSSLLRETLNGNVKLPNDTALQCNNMVDRSKCETFE